MKTRRTKPQMRLTKAQRLQNLEGSITLALPARKNVLKGKSFLLIDDVCTTGSTLLACAKVLRSAGAQKVLALTVARDL
jgi:predicted amidophosphoribosyltransferase